MEKNKEELEISKLEKEIESFDRKIRSERRTEIRTWITSASVIVGILVSTFGAYETLMEVKAKNKYLAIEAQIRSRDIFLNQVLDKMSGTKVKHYELGSDGEFKEVRREKYARTTQYGAYAVAITLAKEFEHLCPAVKKVLTMQDPSEPEYVASLLAELNTVPGC